MNFHCVICQEMHNHLEPRFNFIYYFLHAMILKFGGGHPWTLTFNHTSFHLFMSSRTMLN